MSHYSDIGFKLNKAEDVVELFNKINSDRNIKRYSWDIGDGSIQYMMYYIDEIRYSAQLDDENNSILRLALGHNNQRISKAKYEGIIRSDMSNGDFDTLMIMKDDIPFWFECPNMDIFHIDPNDKEELDLKIASFANSIEIIDPNAKSDDKDDKLKFADESYISDFQNNPVNAFVSGVIKDFKIESNSVSGESYYVIDIDCLGLYFSLLVDSEMIDVTEIEVGKIARGVFYNTALLVADNHPDYF